MPTYLIAGRGRVVERRGAPTPVDGLAVTESRKPGVWSVTHIRSGLSLGFYFCPEVALGAAVALGPLADWTAGGETLRAQRGLRRAVRRIAARHGSGGAGYFPDYAPDIAGDIQPL